jgi:hypothetical protein
VQINCDVAKLGLKVVKAQNTGAQQFTAKDFILRLVQKYNRADDDEGNSVALNWETMRIDAACYFDATPSCHFIASECVLPPPVCGMVECVGRYCRR